jgi:hypothetical protein
VRVAPSYIEASVRSLRACGPSFACLAIPRRRAASKSPRSPIAADMANLLLFAMLNQISDALRIPMSQNSEPLVSPGLRGVIEGAQIRQTKPKLVSYR